MGRSAGPRASEHPHLRLQSRKASGGQRLLCRGEGSLGRLVLLLGAVLLGGDVDEQNSLVLARCFLYINISIETRFCDILVGYAQPVLKYCKF